MDKKKTIEQFDDWSATYDEGIWSIYFNAANKRVFRYLKENVKKDGDILDVGCGLGGLLKNISQYFTGDLVGLDISPGMLKMAEKVCDKKVQFVLGDIENFKTKRKFDAIVCMNSFHHYENHEFVFKIMYNMLKKGGIFLLLDPHRDNPIRELWNKILKNVFNEHDVKYFTKGEFKKMAEKNKLSVIHQENYLYFALISVFRRE